jgi:hypothetical protein
MRIHGSGLAMNIFCLSFEPSMISLLQLGVCVQYGFRVYDNFSQSKRVYMIFLYLLFFFHLKLSFFLAIVFPPRAY